MQFGTPGAGSSSHIACVILNSIIGVDVTNVPYRGSAPAMQDLVGGRTDYQCDQIVTAKPQINSGNVKAIAILSRERSPSAAKSSHRARTRRRCADICLDCALSA